MQSGNVPVTDVHYVYPEVNMNNRTLMTRMQRINTDKKIKTKKYFLGYFMINFKFWKKQIRGHQ